MSVEHYSGSCQCGAVAFEVDADLTALVTCNCSRCRRLGSVLAFAPREAFTLLRGEPDLSEYTFNRQVIRHQFCRTCGIEPFAYGALPDGSPMAAINVNCLDGVDARALPAHHHDGAAD